MNYFRIVGCVLLTYSGYWVMSNSLMYTFYSLPSAVVIDGILNIWSGFGLFFIGIYLVLYWTKEAFQLSISIGEGKKIVPAIGLILCPLLTVIVYQTVHTKLDKNGYTECHDLQRISTRYISNTYTKTPELCTQLVAEK